jgi:hypothetical protein
MKLYLTQILKEANALGFGAPGQGGNAAATSMASLSTAPTAAGTLQTTPSAQPSNPQQMMLPNTGGTANSQIQPGRPAFNTIL